MGRTASSAAGAPALKAGLLAAEGRFIVVWSGGELHARGGRGKEPAWPKRSAGLAGFPFYGELYFVKSGPAAGCCRLYRFSGEGGSSWQRRAVSSDQSVKALVVKHGV